MSVMVNKRNPLVSFDQVGLEELPRSAEWQFQNASCEIAFKQTPNLFAQVGLKELPRSVESDFQQLKPTKITQK